MIASRQLKGHGVGTGRPGIGRECTSSPFTPPFMPVFVLVSEGGFFVHLLHVLPEPLAITE